MKYELIPTLFQPITILDLTYPLNIVTEYFRFVSIYIMIIIIMMMMMMMII